MAHDFEDDPLGFIRHHIRHARNHTGSEPTSASMHDDFLRLDQNQRSAFLTQVDMRLSTASLTLNEARKLHEMRRSLISADLLAKRGRR